MPTLRATGSSLLKRITAPKGNTGIVQEEQSTLYLPGVSSESIDVDLAIQVSKICIHADPHSPALSTLGRADPWYGPRAARSPSLACSSDIVALYHPTYTASVRVNMDYLPSDHRL